jgi:seryl-tRNA synthetase
MLDIKLFRTDVELIKENLRKKFQEHKIPLADEIVELDRQSRETRTKADALRSKRNSLSKEVGVLMAKGLKDEAESKKAEVEGSAQELAGLEALEEKLSAEIRSKMMIIPNIIDSSVPIGRNDSENVEVERFGEAHVPDFEIPYHVDIMEKFSGLDLESARKTSGSGFYFLCGDVARLHSAVSCSYTPCTNTDGGRG